MRCGRRRRAVLVEGEREQIGDGFGRPRFDVPPFDHVDELAVLEEANRRRRGRKPGEIAARTLGGIDVGDRTVVQVDSLQLPLWGVVEHIERRTEFTPRYLYSERERATLVVRVRIRIDDRAHLLHAGVPAFARIARGG